MKTTFIVMVTSIALLLSIDIARAEDMWKETPDLEKCTTPAFASEPNRLSPGRPRVDRWAETPNLDIDHPVRRQRLVDVVIRKGRAHPEMYAETPNLGKIMTSKMEKGENDRKFELPESDSYISAMGTISPEGRKNKLDSRKKR